jgi:hypothetical protein
MTYHWSAEKHYRMAITPTDMDAVAEIAQANSITVEDVVYKYCESGDDAWFDALDANNSYAAFARRSSGEWTDLLA